jgi:alpha-L-fucosidase
LPAVAASGASWFDGAGLGLFVHWGHSSAAGRELSWPMVGGGPTLPHSGECTVAEYFSSVARFSPAPGAAREWCAAARRAGARYAVLTTRHHDGFALWPSAHSSLSVSDAAYDGDLVAEFVEAARAEGLRVGFYLSLSDWHHPDYPAFTDENRPYAFIAYPRPEPAAWARYVDDLFGQVRELLTGYGTIDVLWFDGGWERSPEEWRAAELEALIRELQPDILLNDRLPSVGDYTTPEQFVPPTAPEGRWEACLTMNQSWGWVPDDLDYKSERHLVHALVETVGRGGNLLLNVGPRGDGSLAPIQAGRLAAVGRWMDRHAEAVHDTEPGLAPWQWYGPSTRRGQRIYLFCVQRPYATATVRGVPIRRVARVIDLGSGEDLAWTTRSSVLDELFSADPDGELEIEVPERLLDPFATVLAIDITPASGA